jgi:hypothetical protein
MNKSQMIRAIAILNLLQPKKRLNHKPKKIINHDKRKSRT